MSASLYSIIPLVWITHNCVKMERNVVGGNLCKQLGRVAAWIKRICNRCAPLWGPYEIRKTPVCKCMGPLSVTTCPRVSGQRSGPC